MTLCDRFPSLTPFSIRRERAKDVYILIARLNKYGKTEKKKNKPNIIRRPAGDDWF